jgi:hypothetical protein
MLATPNADAVQLFLTVAAATALAIAAKCDHQGSDLAARAISTEVLLRFGVRHAIARAFRCPDGGAHLREVCCPLTLAGEGTSIVPIHRGAAIGSSN